MHTLTSVIIHVLFQYFIIGVHYYHCVIVHILRGCVLCDMKCRNKGSNQHGSPDHRQWKRLYIYDTLAPLFLLCRNYMIHDQQG